jgi:hypothetical protein
MQEALTSLQNRLAPAEEIFFTWLARVMAAAILVGSAWIDDAPPLEIVAVLIALYVAARIVIQFGALVSAAPLENRVLKILFALVALVLLAGSFAIVAIFAERVAMLVADAGAA